MTDIAADTLIQRYFDAFNARDTEGFLDLLTDDVVHEIGQDDGRTARETGKPAFRAFLDRTTRCYEQKVVDLFVMASPDGSGATAEFTLLGVYLETDAGLPEAEGQRYARPAGAVFEIRDGKVARVSNPYPGDALNPAQA
ncbi:MAG: nuclear transport factor 2 family protein [Ferrovibrio sp.]|uniref:nuclear transport factor 2 family protein n=1 Tax=Ferrovibrio sp. TaxID=1917215 RepID=UPI0026373AB1|nr:nuclear transport factor 2 family protein [Ferrovibrio sp.]MCW0235480.1 nuclear transport factor 2 family protein [Ferrovibrio sp.]